MPSNASCTRFRRSLALVSICVLFGASWLSEAPTAAAQSAPSSSDADLDNQTKGARSFQLRSGIRLEVGSAGRLDVRGHDEPQTSRWQMRWVGARDAALVSAGSRAGTTQENSIGQLQFRDLYPGISLVYHRRSDEVEYDLWIAPHADPAAIRFEVSGADAVWLDADGDLVIRSGRELFFQRKPVSYQMKGEIRTPVDSAFRQVSPGEFGFWLGDYDRTAELVIDPVIEKGVKFGGEGGDSAYGFHTNQTGAFYLFGSSLSQNLPALRAQPAYSWKNGVGGYRYFVSKLKNDLSAAEYNIHVDAAYPSGWVGHCRFAKWRVIRCSAVCRTGCQFERPSSATWIGPSGPGISKSDSDRRLDSRRHGHSLLGRVGM